MLTTNIFNSALKAIKASSILMVLVLMGCAHSTDGSRVSRNMENDEKLSELNRQAYQAFQNAMLERAEPLYRKIVERQPSNHDAYFMLGNIYLRLGQLDASVAHYQKALELKPTDSRIWYNLYLATIQQAINTLESGLLKTSNEDVYYEPMRIQLNKLYELHSEQNQQNEHNEQNE